MHTTDSTYARDHKSAHRLRAPVGDIPAPDTVSRRERMRKVYLATRSGVLSGLHDRYDLLFNHFSGKVRPPADQNVTRVIPTKDSSYSKGIQRILLL